MHIVYLSVTDMWFRSGKMEGTGCNTDSRWNSSWDGCLHGTRGV